MHDNWIRLETVLRGGIPDRVPLVHTWGPHWGHFHDFFGRQPKGADDHLTYNCKMGLPTGLRVGHGGPYGGASGTASDGTSHYMQGGMVPGESLAKYDRTPDLSELVEQAREAVKVSHSYGLGAEGFVTSCIHAVSIALGLEGLALAAYEHADWLEDAMEIIEHRNRRAMAVYIDAGIDIVLFDGDCAYKQGLMLSPEMMRRFWFGRTKETIQVLHDAGTLAYYHTDGNVYELLGMLIELGFVAFHGCEKAANDLGHLKRTFGDKITLFGNADHTELTFWTPERIAAETEQMMRIGAPGGRYAADVNTSMPACAAENYQAFLDTVNRMSAYNPDGTLVEA